MAIWGRNDFLSAPTTVELVELPTGDQAYVRVLSNEGQDLFEDMVSQARLDAEAHGKPPEQGIIQDYRERMLVLMACDAQGRALFSDQDIAHLKQIDHTLTDPIIQRGNALNRLTRATLDEVEKKEPIDQNDACGSALQDSLVAAVSPNGSA